MFTKAVPDLQYFPYSTKRRFDAGKREAERQFKAALQHGLLTKKPCERCGRKAAEGHHEDYRFPLAVVWLCRKHHRARHAELRRGAVPQVPEAEVQSLTIRSNRSLALNAETSIGAVTAATSAVTAVMDSKGVNENSLAKQLGVSRQWINVQFHGGIRSLRSLGTLADALDCDVRIELVHRPGKVVAA